MPTTFPCKAQGCPGHVVYAPKEVEGAQMTRPDPEGDIYLICEYGHELPYRVTRG